MRQFKYYFLGTLAVIILQGCTKNDSVINNKEDETLVNKELSYYERVSLLEDYTIPESKALNLLKNFQDSISTGLYSRSDPGNTLFNVIDRYNIPLYSQSQTRSGERESQTGNTLIYKIQMQHKNSCGYALVAGDLRAPNIIAYIPDTTEALTDERRDFKRELLKISINANLSRIRKFESIKDSLKNSAINKKDKIATRSTKTWDLYDFYESALSYETSTDYLPLSTTAWDQGAPYNCKLAQDCPQQSDGRYAAGCGVVAIAQAMAYYEPSLTINGTSINWKELKRTNTISDSSPKAVKNQVGYLMKWIGEKVGATYTCDGTSTRSNDIIKALSLVGMKCDNRMDWDWNIIYQSLKQKKLVHVDARTDQNEGHAWIIDGFLIGKMPDSTDLIYVHNNMGWGTNTNANGYYEIEPDISFQGGGFNLKYNFGINPYISKK